MTTASTLAVAPRWLGAVAAGAAGAAALVLLAAAARSEEPVSLAPLEVSIGDDGLSWGVPRDERLEYDVEIEIGVLGNPHVGRMTLESGVKPFQSGVLLPSSNAVAGDDLEAAWIRARARGQHMVYKLDELIETSWLPQDFPTLYYRSTQTGSEHRQRQIKIGAQDGAPHGWYRSDRHCKGCQNREHFLKPNWAWSDESHCGRCKRAEHRIWGKPETRSVGPRTVDMLSAVLIARSMVERGEETIAFQVLDKTDLWDIVIRRGERKTIEVPAGKFRAVPLSLTTSVPAGEPVPEDQKFAALFGLHGTLRIWVEEHTGVPLLIAGDVPAGPLNFGVRASLTGYHGTPAGFVRLDRESGSARRRD